MIGVAIGPVAKAWLLRVAGCGLRVRPGLGGPPWCPIRLVRGISGVRGVWEDGGRRVRDGACGCAGCWSGGMGCAAAEQEEVGGGGGEEEFAVDFGQAAQGGAGEPGAVFEFGEAALGDGGAAAVEVAAL